jgi:hypothetical protein
MIKSETRVYATDQNFPNEEDICINVLTRVFEENEETEYDGNSSDFKRYYITEQNALELSLSLLELYYLRMGRKK